MSLWRDRNFLKLWAASTVSDFGSLVTRVALPFAAVLVLNATPFQMALLSAADLTAGLLVGLVAGVWVDRVRRRPVMIATDLGRAAVLMTIPLAAAFGVLQMEQLYVVEFLAGAMTMIFVIAYQAYLPTLIRRERLVRGNSILTASSAVAEVTAFGSTGWLVQLLTAPVAILLDAFSFLFSAGAVAMIRHPEPQLAAPAKQPSVRAEIADGARAVWNDPRLRAAAGSLVTMQMGFQIIRPVFALFALNELGFAPGVLGMIYAVGGVSSLGGALLVERAARRWGLGRAMIGGLLLGGIGMLLTPLARGAGWLSVSLLIGQQLISDGAVTAYEIGQLSLRQTITPDRVLGRVNATIRTVGHVLMLAAVLTGGLLGQTVGLRATLVIGACMAFVAALWLALSPIRTIRETMPLPAEVMA